MYCPGVLSQQVRPPGRLDKALGVLSKGSRVRDRSEAIHVFFSIFVKLFLVLLEQVSHILCINRGIELFPTLRNARYFRLFYIKQNGASAAEYCIFRDGQLWDANITSKLI